MLRTFLQRPYALALVVLLSAGGCLSRTYDLSEYFVVKEKGSMFQDAHRDIYMRSQTRKLDYVGSTWHQWYTTGFNVLVTSQDGRSVVYAHHPGVAGRRSQKDGGIYQYIYGEGERLLQAGRPAILPQSRFAQGGSPPKPMHSVSPKPIPSDLVVFFRDRIKWAATAEGETFPLVLYGATPLHKAVFEDNESEFISLLNSGEYLNDQNYWGLTPLALAIVRGDEEVALQLLEHGPDPLAGEFKPIHLAAYYGQWRVLEAILESGADPNVTDHDGKTPLHRANRQFTSRSWHPMPSDFGGGRRSEDQELPETIEGLRLLLAHGADVNAKDAKGRAALHDVIGQGHESLTLFIAHGADPNSKDAEGRTPLHYAIQESVAAKIVQELLGAGADANALDNGINTPLHFVGGRSWLAFRGEGRLIEGPHGKAIWKQEYKPVLQLLIAQSTDIDHLNAEGLSPLHLAVRRRALNTAEFLVENGADDSVRYVPRDLRSVARTYMDEDFESKWPTRSIRVQMKRVSRSDLWNTDRD